MQNPTSIPVIFIHEGASFYLPYVLSQVHFSNPESEIILIGDKKALKQAPEWIKKIPASLYAETADAFTALYKNAHRSYNSFRFENSCFRRTFLLEEYCRSSGTDHCWYFDSDVLVYGNLTEEIKYFPDDCYWSCAGETLLSPHSSFWTLAKLTEFNAFLMQSMTPGTKEFMELERDWERYKKENTTGGICDMSVLAKFAQYYPDHFYNTIQTSGGSWNQTFFNSFPELQRSKPFHIPAEIFFQKGFFYFKTQKMFTIHCQGFTKRYIPYFYTGPNRLKLFLQTLQFLPRRLASFIRHDLFTLDVFKKKDK